MTEAQQREAFRIALAHHAAHCPDSLPITAMLDGKGWYAQTFGCRTCGTDIIVSSPIRPTPRNRTTYELGVRWGTIGPPTPENAPNPTASEGV